MQIGVLNNRFYVYEHLRLDAKEIFYVGKGSGNRAWQLNPARRSDWWSRVFKKANGAIVRIIANNLEEELAHLIEIERIDQLRKIGCSIVNLTDGGDGTSGIVRSDEWRKMMSAVHKGKTLSDDTRKKISESVRNSGYVHSKEVREKIASAHRGHKRSLGRKAPPEECARRSIAAKSRIYPTGHIHSKETKEKMSIAHKGISQNVLICPYCEKKGGNAMRRWHFDFCKMKTL